MKNKRKTILTLIIFTIVFILAIVALVFIYGKRNSTKPLSLQQFKQGEAYQFNDVSWNISFEEVSRKLPFKLLTDPGRVPAPEGYAFYNSKNSFNLYGQQAIASFEFQSDALKIIQFSFNFDTAEECEAWFDKIVTESTNLYGAERDKKENSGENALGQFNSTVYTWETDNTMLQLSLITGNKISPSAMIGVAAK